MALTRKQAGVDLADGRKPGAGTFPTEGLRDLGNEANFPSAITVAPTLGHLARIILGNRF